MSAKKKTIIATASVLILLVFCMLTYVEFSEYRSKLNNQILDTTQTLNEATNALEARLQINIELVKGLAAYLIINPTLSQENFSKYAAELLNTDSNISVVAASDAYIVTHLYPMLGNEKVFGMDYRNIEEQLSSIERALSLQEIIVSGPVNLVQGGKGLIARMPILKSNEQWGIISVVIDYVDFLSKVNLNQYASIDITIKGKDAYGYDGDVFFGDPDSFEQSDIKQELLLPHGSWIVSASPADGWVTFQYHWHFTFVAMLLVAAISYNTYLRLRNETMSEESTAALQKLAHYDGLTGLPNRILFKQILHDRITTYQKQRLPFAVLFLDLDKFKIINDSLGHDAGDELLKLVSERIKASVKDKDIFARLGGDEFVLLTDRYNSPEELGNIAAELCELLRKPFYIMDDIEVSLGISIGISQYPTDSVDISELMSFADASMYKAKLSDTEKIVYYNKQISDEANALFTIKSEIKVAANNNEFELYFQPIIDLETGSSIGAEALIRWNHPTRGLLAPFKFIPLAESTGAIKIITHWVFDEVMKTLRRWQFEKDEFCISFNVSAAEVCDTELLQYVTKALEKDPTLAKKITIEITESSLVENTKEAIEIIQGFRDLGLRIAIDDFGTGFSSLAYLSHLPIDILKIDRSFIMHIETDEHINIVKSVMDLAENFELTVVAEGIETKAQEAILKGLNCPLGQGYHYSKPVPISEFEEHFGDIRSNTVN